MRLLTASQARALDTAAEASGHPMAALMEAAGLRVAQAARHMLGELAGRQVVVACGRGNNGGDGLVAARYLANAGAHVRIFLAISPDAITGLPGTYLGAARRAGAAVAAPVAAVDQVSDATEEWLVSLREAAGRADLIVDALLGVGMHGAPRGVVAAAIDEINAAGRPVLAVDVASGLNADTGQAPGAVIRATATVTMSYAKPGHLTGRGRDLTGRLYIGDIGFPVTAEAGLAGPVIRSPDAREIAAMLPARPHYSHKGTYGHLLVVGGSTGFTGAAALAAQGGLRSGGGLVTVACPASGQPGLATKLTEAMTWPLPETDGRLNEAAARALAAGSGRFTAVALGPGLGRGPGVTAFVRSLLTAGQAPALPMVIDADGLNALAEILGGGDWPRRDEGPGAATGPGVVLTPHPGELARLLNASVEDIEGDRIASAARAAEAWQVVVLLKGSGTVVADPGGRVAIIPTGGPYLATGGTGDVLCGLIGGLMAQGVPAWEAAVAGAFLHGLAGDLAARRLGPAGVLAGEVAAEIPAARRAVERDRVQLPWRYLP